MKKYALLVGVEDYRDKMISRLNFACADAAALAERLSDRCMFDQVRVLADESGENEPLLVNIVTALRDTASELRQEDLFLFFFAGHGVEKNGHGYLLARDSLQAFPEHGSLSLELLRKTFECLSAGKRILLLDACRNSPDASRSDSANCMGDVISRDIVAAARSRLTGGMTTALLSACRSGQRAYEWPAKGHGVFTQYLVEGLDGAAWTGYELEFRRLASYAAKQVRQWAANTAGLPTPQEPWYEEFGDPEAILIGAGQAGPDDGTGPSSPLVPDSTGVPHSGTGVCAGCGQSVLITAASPRCQSCRASFHPMCLIKGPFLKDRTPDGSGNIFPYYCPACFHFVAIGDDDASEFWDRVSWGSHPDRTMARVASVLKHTEVPGFLEAVPDAQYARLGGLYAGSEAAQKCQMQWVEKGYPLEVVMKKTGIVFRLVPPGEFLMGSPREDNEASYEESPQHDEERPQHKVTIASPMYVGKFPVTQQQWEGVMGQNPARFQTGAVLQERRVKKSFWSGKETVEQEEVRLEADTRDHPVERVPWDDCQAFLNRMHDQLDLEFGKAIRLLTEAQWEYACRAGTTGSCYGNLDVVGWYDSNSLGMTHPVGQKRPNAWGLHDMIGNVSEWCEDTWHEGYKNAPTDGSAWEGRHSSRVVRGGGWDDDLGECRSAARGVGSLDNGLGSPGRYSDVGFRVVVDLE